MSIAGSCAHIWKPSTFRFRFHAERHGRPVEYVYFPDSGLISVVVDLGGRHQSEAGSVGWDACTGHSVILGGGVAITTTYVQIPGARPSHRCR